MQLRIDSNSDSADFSLNSAKTGNNPASFQVNSADFGHNPADNRKNSAPTLLQAPILKIT